MHSLHSMLINNRENDRLWFEETRLIHLPEKQKNIYNKDLYYSIYDTYLSDINSYDYEIVKKVNKLVTFMLAIKTHGRFSKRKRFKYDIDLIEKFKTIHAQEVHIHVTKIVKWCNSANLDFCFKETCISFAKERDASLFKLLYCWE